MCVRIVTTKNKERKWVLTSVLVLYTSYHFLPVRIKDKNVLFASIMK